MIPNEENHSEGNWYAETQFVVLGAHISFLLRHPVLILGKVRESREREASREDLRRKLRT